MKKDREDRQRKLQEQESKVKREKKPIKKDEAAKSEKMFEEKIQKNTKGSFVEIE